VVHESKAPKVAKRPSNAPWWDIFKEAATTGLARQTKETIAAWVVGSLAVATVLGALADEPLD
jgi:hypothetical protein